MLSYRHAFHVGNHADVIKHIVLTKILSYLLKKDKPVTYLDSHAGAGLYNLADPQAQKTGEYHLGVKKILHNTRLKSLAEEYFQILHQVNPELENKGLTIYPGSPFIAKLMLRPQDKILAVELHNSEIENLKQNLEFWKDRRINIHHRDGFEGLKALTPPAIRRGLVLMDPSYEMTEDYKKTMDAVSQVLQRWPEATVMVWYPFLRGSKDHSLFMHEKARKLKAREIIHVALCPYSSQEGPGMYGSGIFIFNPTFGLLQELRTFLPVLHEALKQSNQAASHAETILQNADLSVNK